jgi:NADH-quinone oxidoreductase subunit C
MTQRQPAEDVLERARSAVGRLETTVNFDQLDIASPRESYVELMTVLRDEPLLRCEFFTSLCGVDRTTFGGEGGEKAGGLEVLCHVYSPEHRIHVNVHVPVDTEQPVCPSITGVYRGADWHEREAWEMFGIVFEGHPNLVHLYLPEDFEGHPMRKSFKLPGRSFVKDWPGAKDPEEAAAGGR